jgi:hypothetical protein
MVHIISVVVQEHIRTHPEEAGSPTVSTLYTKDPQRKKLTKRYMGILVSFPVARLAPFAPPEQPPEGEKTKTQRTQIRRGSLADSQLYGPREWLAKDEAVHFVAHRPGQRPKANARLRICSRRSTPSMERSRPASHHPHT